VVVVSARTGQGFPELLRIIEAELPRPEIRVEVLLPYDRGDLVNRLHTEGDVLAEEHTATGTRVEAKVERDLHGALGEFAC
jgi:GTP-binding protein HflX